MKLTSCGRCISSVVVPRDFIAAQRDLFPFDDEIVLPPTVDSTAGPKRTRFDSKPDDRSRGLLMSNHKIEDTFSHLHLQILQ